MSINAVSALDQIADHQIHYRTVWMFTVSILVGTGLMSSAVRDLLHYSATSEASYIPLVPFMSAFLIGFRGKYIMSGSVAAFHVGIPVALLGPLIYSLCHVVQIGSSNWLTVEGLSVVLLWLGIFIAYFGWRTARKATLPLGLLLFVVPWPPQIIAGIISYLQHGSAVLSYTLFRLIGVPAVRDGTLISLPRLNIEVAPQCSGIRSSISLVILTLAGVNLYVRSVWGKVMLVAIIVPLVIVKNAIRIVTLSTLGLYVDRGFLTGHLHHDGGVVFFLVAMLILFPVLLLVQRFERRVADTSTKVAIPAAPQSRPTAR